MNKKPLVLLIDTTVLYSGLVYKGLENKVLMSGNYIFITTEFTVAEIYRLLTTKRGLSREGALKLIRSIPMLVVNYDFIKNKWEEADRLIGFRDKSDIPLVALALTIENHDGIWSTDTDFEVVKDKFRIWKTRELL
ncbi:MAG: PIN domain-containing protein [Candidatus Aenigmatarchaeota archaeon]